ncbi:MAG: SpoIIE family protein phosphatase [Chloroflexota bacterium]
MTAVSVGHLRQQPASPPNWTTISTAVLVLSLLAIGYMLWQRYRSRQQLLARVAELEALSAAGRTMVAAEADLSTLCQIIANEVGQIIEATTFQIGLFHGDLYEILYWRINGRLQTTPQYEELTQHEDFGQNEGFVNWVRQHQQPLIIRDFPNEREQLPVQPSSVSNDPARSAIFIPLLSSGKPLGVMTAQSHAPNRFNEEDERRLTILANQAAAAIANARLLAAERKRATELELVGKIARQVNIVSDLEEIFTQVVNLTAETFGFHPVNIFVRDPETFEATIQASSEPSLCDTGLRLAPGEGLVGTAVAYQTTIVTNNTAKDGRFLQQPPNLQLPFQTRSEACFPLIVENDVLGVLDVQSEQRNAFSDSDVTVLEALAEEVASAIFKALQVSRQREQAWLSIAQLQIVEALGRSQNLEEIGTAVVRLTPMLSGVNLCGLLIYNPDNSHYRLASFYGPQEPTEQQLAIGDWHALDAVHVGQARLTTRQIPSWLQPDPPDKLDLLPLIVPSEENMLGVLFVDVPNNDVSQATTFRNSQQMHQKRQELLENIALQTAQAVESSQLRSAQQEEAWVNTALLQVAEAVNNLIDLNEILDTIVRLIPLLVGVKSVLILVWDEEQGLFRPSSNHGVNEMGLGVIGSLGITHDEWFQIQRQLADWLAPTAAYSLIHPPHWLKSALNSDDIYVLPLNAQGRMVGKMVVGLVDNGRSFSPRRLNMLNGIAHQAATAVVNNQLYRESAERNRLEQELSFAQEIQISFLPKTNPTIPHCTIASHWQAARQVSGDFYDFLPLSNDKWGIIIADVADKGVPAALFMALSRTVLRTVALNREWPAETLVRANQIIDNDAQSDLFVTVFYAVWDPFSHQLTYANAGHNPPLLVRATGKIELLKNTGVILGILPDVEIHQRTITLHPNDTLLCYTDGVTEAMNTDRDEYGLQRLQLAAAHAQHQSVDQIIETITADIQDYVGATPQSDDITLVVLKRD